MDFFPTNMIKAPPRNSRASTEEDIESDTLGISRLFYEENDFGQTASQQETILTTKYVEEEKTSTNNNNLLAESNSTLDLKLNTLEYSNEDSSDEELGLCIAAPIKEHDRNNFCMERTKIFTKNQANQQRNIQY